MYSQVRLPALWLGSAQGGRHGQANKAKEAKEAKDAPEIPAALRAFASASLRVPRPASATDEVHGPWVDVQARNPMADASLAWSAWNDDVVREAPLHHPR